ncbi:MAG: DUF2029 domain-containing protein, partial [Chloroflexi bacterium]|nr:DUF2029 domain-containing protein [Chloroflexota bacterium]
IVWPYAYPPLIAVALVPATFLPYGLVRVGWWVLGVGSVVGGVWLLLRAMDALAPPYLALALLLLVRFEPLVSALRLGQMELLQFLLLALALYALTLGRLTGEAIGGLALGVAAGLKFFPGALIALLLWRRRWRAAAWALGTMLACIAAPAWVTGFDLSKYWGYASIYGLGGAFAGFPLNQSLNGFFSRNLVHNVFTVTLKGVHLPGLAKGLTLASSALIVGLSAWLTRGTKGRQSRADEHFALAYGLAIVALLLISPHSQVYTYVWALLPLLILFIQESRMAERSLWWMGGVLAYLLIGRRYTFFYPGLTRIVQAHVLVGGVCLWLLLAVMLWRRQRAANRAIEDVVERAPLPAEGD